VALFVCLSTYSARQSLLSASGSRVWAIRLFQ
jgi:hypothetical protein